MSMKNFTFVLNRWAGISKRCLQLWVCLWYTDSSSCWNWCTWDPWTLWDLECSWIYKQSQENVSHCSKSVWPDKTLL